MPYVVNISDVIGVTRSGRVFTTVPPINIKASVGKKMQVVALIVNNKPDFVGDSSGDNINTEFDEVLRLI